MHAFSFFAAGELSVEGQPGQGQAIASNPSNLSCRWLPGLVEDGGGSGSEGPVAAAAQELIEGAVSLWPALSGWRVKEVR